MKTLEFNYAMEVLEDFDEDKFNDGLMDLATKNNCVISGYLEEREYPKNRFQLIWWMIQDAFYVLRYGV